jgi:Domain of unknown function (DUF4440)
MTGGYLADLRTGFARKIGCVAFCRRLQPAGALLGLRGVA